MSLSTLTYKLTVSQNIQALKTLTGSTDFNPISNTTNINKAVSLGTAAANAAAGGADELAAFVTSITASGSATIDLTALTDILNQTSVTLARVKSIIFRLLNAADDATNGTAASSVTIGNNGTNDYISQSHGGWLASATSTFDVPSGGWMGYGVGNAAGNVVDGTHKIIKVANNDGSLTAKVQSVICGGTS